MSALQVPSLLPGGLATDDRGTLRFVNEFTFSDVKRFYVVSNHSAHFVRAWHAHRNEAKFVLVSVGAAVVGAVKVDSWDQPSRDLEVHRYVLAANKPSILHIPAGYANGFMSLTADTQVFFFSTSSLEQSGADDVRFPARHWDIWNVEER